MHLLPVFAQAVLSACKTFSLLRLLKFNSAHPAPEGSPVPHLKPLPGLSSVFHGAPCICLLRHHTYRNELAALPPAILSYRVPREGQGVWYPHCPIHLTG